MNTESIVGSVSGIWVFPVKSIFALVLDERFNMVHPMKIPFWRLVTTPTKF